MDQEYLVLHSLVTTWSWLSWHTCSTAQALMINKSRCMYVPVGQQQWLQSRHTTCMHQISIYVPLAVSFAFLSFSNSHLSCTVIVQSYP